MTLVTSLVRAPALQFAFAPWAVMQGHRPAHLCISPTCLFGVHCHAVVHARLNRLYKA